jgi:homocysteine S-methyltransferase
MAAAADPVAEGIILAREMLAHARDGFAGAFLMPPFDRYDVVDPILS